MTDIFAQLAKRLPPYATTVEAGVRALLHEANVARVAWEAAGSPADSPLRDAYTDAADRFRAAVVDHVEGVRMRRGLYPIMRAYLNRMGVK